VGCAIALWALFSAFLPGSDCKLILDREATVDGIKRPLKKHPLLLQNVMIQPFLIFTGSTIPDHRLVAHNTTSDAWEITTPLRSYNL